MKGPSDSLRKRRLRPFLRLGIWISVFAAFAFPLRAGSVRWVAEEKPIPGPVFTLGPPASSFEKHEGVSFYAAAPPFPWKVLGKLYYRGATEIWASPLGRGRLCAAAHEHRCDTLMLVNRNLTYLGSPGNPRDIPLSSGMSGWRPMEEFGPAHPHYRVDAVFLAGRRER
ncbi:protein of unknown function [Methylacidimicrobium sp. AP8]|uniref:hypothetical protein n=1 Tax=Methylacidimicrobium sp. AP8 TaxID=2730359 RepID=UPI0018C13A2D|nr:hypothetical protein [Methylacidimicrobium sp. AP8]CAB4243224.1 protein of unknown function [Methylacidimicrobium sp. AP8]